MPKKREADVEARIAAIIARAASELNDAFPSLDITAVEAPVNRTAEFTITRLGYDHAIGFLRAFAFIPLVAPDKKTGIVTLAGFTIALHLHMNEKNAVQEFRERSLLETPAEQYVFKERIKGFLATRIPLMQIRTKKAVAVIVAPGEEPVVKYATLAIIGILLIAAISTTTVSQGKRAECLQDCRSDGDYCAEKAYRTNAACTAGKVICDTQQTAALRECQHFYDRCRYVCDIPRF